MPISYLNFQQMNHRNRHHRSHMWIPNKVLIHRSGISLLQIMISLRQSTNSVKMASWSMSRSATTKIMSMMWNVSGFSISEPRRIVVTFFLTHDWRTQFNFNVIQTHYHLNVKWCTTSTPTRVSSGIASYHILCAIKSFCEQYEVALFTVVLFNDILYYM